MSSRPIIAPRFPMKLPQPARPASIIRLPAMNSPVMAPITGPTNNPMIPKKRPITAPRIAPKAAPPCRAEKFCAKIATQKIERVGNECKQCEDRNRSPADALVCAEHQAMHDGRSENNGRTRKNWNDRTDQANGEQADCDQPPEDFHCEC